MATSASLCHTINGTGVWSTFLTLCYCNRAAFQSHPTLCDVICDQDYVSRNCKCKDDAYAGDQCDGEVCMDNNGQWYCLEGSKRQAGLCLRNINEKRAYPPCPCLNGGFTISGRCVCALGYNGSICNEIDWSIEQGIMSKNSTKSFPDWMAPVIALPTFFVTILILWLVCRYCNKAKWLQAGSHLRWHRSSGIPSIAVLPTTFPPSYSSTCENRRISESGYTNNRNCHQSSPDISNGHTTQQLFTVPTGTEAPPSYAEATRNSNKA